MGAVFFGLALYLQEPPYFWQSYSSTDEMISDPLNNFLECKDISNPYKKQECFVIECENEKYFDACISRSIPNELNITESCVAASTTTRKITCFSIFAYEYGNDFICDDFISAKYFPEVFSKLGSNALVYEKESQCYRRVAKKTKDIGVCNKIKNEFTKEGCVDYDIK